MKKMIYTAALLALTNWVSAQSFLNKIKDKVTKAVDKPADQQKQDAQTNSGFTDPAKFGTLIKTFSKAEMNAHSGSDGYGFAFYFKSVKAVNGQIQAQIGDADLTLYSYNGSGQLQAIGKPTADDYNKLAGHFVGTVDGQQSKDFTQHDTENAMLKKGPAVASGMQAGKIGQTYTFNGKPLGTFMAGNVAHNADSSVVAVAGMAFDKGVSYKMVSSNGQQYVLPVKILGYPVLSPDGKATAVLVQNLQGKGIDVCFSNGTMKTITASNFNQVWLTNGGNIFSIEGTNSKIIDKNGVLFATLDAAVDVKALFVSADDQRMCWAGARGINFTDGTKFENAMTPTKLVINGKEVIAFLDVDLASGTVYLCQHDL